MNPVTDKDFATAVLAAFLALDPEDEAIARHAQLTRQFLADRNSEEFRAVSETYEEGLAFINAEGDGI